MTHTEILRKLKSLSTGWVHKTFPDEVLFGWQEGTTGIVDRSSGKCFSLP